MAELTPEERERVYLEEKERKEAEEKAVRDRIYAEEKVRHEVRTRIWKEETGRLLKSAKGLTGISKSVVQYLRAKAGVSIAIFAVLVLSGFFWWQTHNLGPSQVVEKYYKSLISKDYASAYALLHPNSTEKAEFKSAEGYQHVYQSQKYGGATLEDVYARLKIRKLAEPAVVSGHVVVLVQLQDMNAGQGSTIGLTQSVELLQDNGEWKILNIEDYNAPRHR